MLRDFPCGNQRWRCMGAERYVAVETHDCHFFCGPGPCSGGSCDPVGAEKTCPSGTRCVPYDFSYDFSDATKQQGDTPCAAADAGIGDAAGGDGGDGGDDGGDARD